MNHLKNILTKVIPHREQRYPTCGDYFEEHRLINFRISEMNDIRHEELVLIHELVEYFLIKDKGLSVKQIDKFDKKFEKERSQGLHREDEEPCFDKRCPYRDCHVRATKLERKLARWLGVNFKKYSREIMSL